jgi:hypothetical protein
MSGMLSQTLLNAGPSGGLITGFGGSTLAFQANEARVPVSILGFRSGPQYDRAVAAGATPQENTLADFYTRQLGDTGHEFRMVKNTIKYSYCTVHGVPPSAFYGKQGKGAQTCITMEDDYSPFLSYEIDPSWMLSDNELKLRGTGFIQDSQPLASEADLLVSLAELIREGLPSGLLRGLLTSGPSRAERIKGFAGDYLNFMFGVTPIIRDFDSVHKALSKIDKTINQWIRDNDRQIRRRRRTKRVTDITPHEYYSRRDQGGTVRGTYRYVDTSAGIEGRTTYTSGTYATTVSNGQGMTKVDTDVSFSSAFSYRLDKLLTTFGEVGPDDIVESNLALRLELTLHSLGLSPNDFSLYTIWNLVPFSWLVDWFVNLGDVLSNQRAFQTAGLQLTWGYITAHQVEKTAWYLRQSFPNEPGKPFIDMGQLYIRKYVRRIRATPFGFGYTFEELSPPKVGVLAALATQATL